MPKPASGQSRLSSTNLSRRTLLSGSAALAAGAFAASPRRAFAQGKGPLKIGVLTDMSSFARDSNGPGSVQAVKMAIEEFGANSLGRPIEVLSADHQMKVDIGANIARKWFDEDDVSVIVDVPNSAIGIAVHNLARERNKVALLGGTFSSDVTNQLCSPNTAQYGPDTYSLGNIAASAIAAEGGKSWFFITSDFAFGHALQADATAALTKAGGKVVGSVRHPPGTTDFSSFLLQAQASGADVIAFANSAGDTINSIKQANEFGLAGGKQRLAALLIFETDIHAIGLAIAKGVYVTLWSYWDIDDSSRAWSRRYFETMKAMPSMAQASNYSSVLHYLKAVRETKDGDTAAIMAAMRAAPINDAFIHGGRLRADGRVIKDMYLAKIKTPGESKEPWDILSIQRTIPGDQAFRPPGDSKCALLPKG